MKIRTNFELSRLTAIRVTTKLSDLTNLICGSQSVSRLLNGTSNGRHPWAEAVQWVAVVTTIAMEMVLPGLAGQWLDGRLGTGFLVLVGFALGLSVGIWHLVQLTKPKSGPSDRPPG